MAHIESIIRNKRVRVIFLSNIYNNENKIYSMYVLNKYKFKVESKILKLLYFEQMLY